MAAGMKTDIIPLRMERERSYPPKLMGSDLDKFTPIDVSRHTPNTEWDHSKELDEIKARLRSFIPVVAANQQVKGKKLPDYMWLMPKPKTEGDEQDGESRRSRPRSRRRMPRSSSARLNSALSRTSDADPKRSEPRLFSPLVFSDDEDKKKKKAKDDWSEDEDSWGDSKIPTSKTRAAKYVPPIDANQSVEYKKPTVEPRKPQTPSKPDELPVRSRTGTPSSRSSISSRSRRRSTVYSSDGQMLKSEYRKGLANKY